MNIYGHFTPSIDELYESLTDEDMLNHYFGDFKKGMWYKSPFRDEINASFTISYYKDKWLWRDFGIDPRPKSGIEFVMRLYNVGLNDAIDIIYRDLILNTNNVELKVVNKKPTTQSASVPTACRLLPMQDSVLKYWLEYNVEKEDLKYYNIYSGEVWYNRSIYFKTTKYKPVSIYMFDIEKKIWKGYNPGVTKRFFSNNISNHIQNYKEVSNTSNSRNVKYIEDVLFITKSYKDCIILNLLGYHAIAPHAESMFLAPWEIDDFKTKFPYIYVFYDSDTTGVTKCTEFTTQNQLLYINIPKEYYPLKDPSDIVKIHGQEILQDIIYAKFKRDGIG